MMLVLAWAVAAEPGPVVVRVETLPPGGVVDAVALPWTTVGFSPAAEEQAAFGPDALAVGPDGAWALWDPVLRRVHTHQGGFALAHATDLGFAADGDVLVLDTRARRLARYTPSGAVVATFPFPGLVPTSVTLRVEDGVAWGVDALGNQHPVARVDRGGLDIHAGPRLREPTHAVVKDGDALEVDGDRRYTAEGLLGGRVEGEWLLVEARGAGGAVTRRAVSLESGAVHVLPGAERRYRPADDVAVGPDGRVAWLEPGADALVIRWGAP